MDKSLRQLTSTNTRDQSNAPGFPGAGGAGVVRLPFPQTAGPGAGLSTVAVPGLGAISGLQRPNRSVGLGLPSFTSIPHHVVTKTDASDPESVPDAKDIGVAQLLFARNDKRAKRKRGAMPRYAPSTATNAEFKELTQLNRHLEENRALYSSAAEVMAEWHYLGVVKNEVAPNSNAGYRGAPASRMLNLIVGHRVQVLDYWAGLALSPSCPLYLVIRGVPGTRGFHYQFVPWSNPDSPMPTLADVTYEDPRTKTFHVADLVRVGRASQYRDAGAYGEGKIDPLKKIISQGIKTTVEVYIGV